MVRETCRLEYLESYEGYDFSNKALISGVPLKEKGLFEPKSERDYGGRKKLKKFMLPSGELAICLEFTDVKVENSVVSEVNNNLDEATHIRKITKFFNDKDEIWFEKEDYEIIKNKKKLKKSRVNYAIDYLVETAELLGASDEVKGIFKHYKVEFDEWKDLGDSSDFILALEAEPDTINSNPNVMYHIINAPIPNFAPKTFKDALIEQMTSEKWVNTNI